jgi:hypothetical protein
LKSIFLCGSTFTETANRWESRALEAK